MGNDDELLDAQWAMIEGLNRALAMAKARIVELEATPKPVEVRVMDGREPGGAD